MANIFSNIDGVINKMFSIGIGPSKMTITVDGSKVVINKEIDFGDNPLNSTADPTSPSNLINLDYFNREFSEFKKEIKDLIPDDLNRFTDGLNYMLPVYSATVDQVENNMSVRLGTLPATKFIDRIVFELIKPFIFKTRNVGYVSIGTIADPNLFVNKIKLNDFIHSGDVPIYKTLTKDTDIYITFYREIEEDPIPEFEQRVLNNHDGVINSITMDGSGKVINITLTGSNLIGSIDNVALFGNSITGNYMDFGVNMNLTPGKTYRIIQENSCLSLYPNDPSITHTEAGLYTKTKDYTFMDNGESFDYYFLVGQKDTNAYTHIYVYDIEDTENAIYTYHIKNNLSYESESMSSLANMINVISDVNHVEEPYSYPDVTVTINPQDDFTTLIELSGENVTSHTEDLLTVYPNLSGKNTALYIPYTPTHNYTIQIINPALKCARDDVVESEGVYSVTSTENLSGENPVMIPVPIGEDKSHNILVTIIDEELNDTYVFEITNNITFVSESSNDNSVTNNTTEEMEDGELLIRIISF